jgi:hypothetical protein
MILPGFTTPEEFGISERVRDYNGAEVGCITTSAPKTRVPESMIDEPAARVLAAATAVSARWGFRPGSTWRRTPKRHQTPTDDGGGFPPSSSCLSGSRCQQSA